MDTAEGDPPDGGGKNDDGNRNKTKKKKEFRYTTADTDPYQLYFELRKDQTGMRLNRYSLGAKLRGMEAFKKHIIDMKQIGRNKIMVILNSFIKANQLMDIINKEEGVYEAYVPMYIWCAFRE